MEKHKNNEQKQHIDTEEKKEQLENKKEEQKNKDDKNYENIIAEKDKKINELTDKYLRALAELDNFRKRVLKDKEDFVKYTKGDTAKTILPILDNLERAVSATDVTNDVNSLKKGIEMIIKQFYDVLKELGLKEIETNGIVNPLYHHILHKEKVQGKKDGEIIEVYQKGYMLDDKVIRPALVKIAYFPEEKEVGNGKEEKKNTESEGKKQGE
jgi:molecular chaperone GrpE